MFGHRRERGRSDIPGGTLAIVTVDVVWKAEKQEKEMSGEWLDGWKSVDGEAEMCAS